MADNPNYVQKNGGWVRNSNAPDEGHKSRLNWKRQENLQKIREGVAEARQKQNQRNEEYRRTHGNA